MTSGARKFRHVENALSEARENLERLRNARSFEESEQRWGKFLRSLDRVWNKIEATCKDIQDFKNWKMRYENLRKNDPMLRYLIAARSADEHGLPEHSSLRSIAMGMKGMNPSGNLTIREWRTDSTGKTVAFDADSPVAMFPIPIVELLPVTNRGTTYQVPKEHLGQALGNSHPWTIGYKALEFYKNAAADGKAQPQAPIGGAKPKRVK